MAKIVYDVDLDGIFNATQEFADFVEQLRDDALKIKDSLDESDIADVHLINTKLIQTFNTIKYIKKHYNKKITSVQNEIKDNVVLHPEFDRDIFTSHVSYDNVETKALIGKKAWINKLSRANNKYADDIKSNLLAKYPHFADKIEEYIPTKTSIAFPTTFLEDDLDFIKALQDENLVEVVEQQTLELY